MKRLLMLVGGLAALGILAYVGKGWAQQNYNAQQPAAAAALRTRIGLLNLTFVIKNYEKYKTFQAEMKSVMTPYQEKDQSLKKEMEAISKDLQSPTTEPSAREEMEKKARTLQREIQENQETAKSVLGKRADEQMKILWGDINDAVTRYAGTHELELVLHYNDATNPKDFFSAPNIARKLQSGACMPMYAAAGMDISQAVVANLNGGSQPSTPSTPAGSGQQ